MGWVKGLEPSTYGTTTRRSSQLSYTHHVPLSKRLTIMHSYNQARKPFFNFFSLFAICQHVKLTKGLFMSSFPPTQHASHHMAYKNAKSRAATINQNIDWSPATPGNKTLNRLIDASHHNGDDAHHRKTAHRKLRTCRKSAVNQYAQ